MRFSVTILVAATMCLATGCKEKTSEPTELAGYDADTDGPACVIQPARDKNITADQTKARQTPRARTGASSGAPASTAPAATAPTGASPVAEVQVRLGAALAAAKAGKEEQFADLFSPPFDAFMRKVVTLAKKTRILGEAARTRLGQDLAKDFIDALGQVSGAPGAPQPEVGPDIDFRKIALDDFKFQAKGQDVAVTGPDGMGFTFVKTGQGWKAKLDIPPPMVGLLTLFEGMLDAQTQVLDGLIAGINDGSITQANLKAKADGLKAKHLKPAMDSFTKAFGALMPTSGPASRPTTAPVTPPTSGGF